MQTTPVRSSIATTSRSSEARSESTSISVVIAGHNAAPHLTEMLTSLISQTDQADEIIYYDDFSTDNSLEILDSFRKSLPQLEVFEGKERIGVSAARNKANGLASSEYIAVLDSDDLFLENTIASYRHAIAGAPDIDLFFGDTVVFNGSPESGKRRHYPAFTESRNPLIRLMVRPIVPFKHSSMLYRKSKIQEIDGYDENLFLKVDFEMFIRFIQCGGTVKKLDEVTSFHRTHANQMSRDRLKGIQSYWSIIDQYEPRLVPAIYLKSVKALGEIAKLIVER